MNNVTHFTLITEEELIEIGKGLCARVGDCHRPKLEKYSDGRYMVPEDRWNTWVRLGVAPAARPS